MTREEKINTLKAIIQECEEYQWQRRETLFEIIKDLEKEPATDSNIPYLMHKEMDIPISECQKAYDVAVEYLRSQTKVKG